LRETFKPNNQYVQNLNHDIDIQYETAREQSEPINSTKKINGSFDWKTALLALLAFLLAGGLIPFWLYIWFSLNTGR